MHSRKTNSSIRSLAAAIALASVFALLVVGTAPAATSKPSPRAKYALKDLKFYAPGATLISARSVRVEIAAPRNIKSLRAVAAGKVVSKRFVRRGDRLVARLPVGKVLKRGVNHINVVIRTSKGKWIGDKRVIIAARGKAPATSRVVAQSTRYLAEVKLKQTADHFVVTLNGRNITSRFSRFKTSKQSVPVSPDEGLRYGRNELRVTAALANGRYLRRVHRFTISRTRPMAAAGKDIVVRAGDKIRLSAGGSLPRSNDVEYSWRVKQSPKGAAPRLAGATGGAPRLTLDRPGKYKIELSATRNGHRGSDIKTVSVVPNTPPIGASVRTFAPQAGGGYAIEIGANCIGSNSSCGEVVSPYEKGKDVQMLVLNRETLAVYQTLQLSGAKDNALGVIAALNSLAGSGEQVDYIVILAAPPGGSTEPGWDLAVEELTGSKPALGTNGGWSAIGVPQQNFEADNLDTGEVNDGRTPALGNTIGEMTGNFAYDPIEEIFTYLPSKTSAYQTSTAASTATQNQMSVGGATYSSDPLAAGCTGGFHMVTVRSDSFTAPSSLPLNQTFSTNCSNIGVGEVGVFQLDAAMQNVTQASPTDPDGPLLVYLQSIGPALAATTNPGYEIGVRAVAFQAEQLGGTADTVMAAFNAGSTGYALAGSTTLQAEAPEASRSLTFAPEATSLQPGSGTQLSGIHRLSRFSHFQPESGSPTSSNIGNLNQVAYQPSSAWPVGSKQGEKNALAYVSKLYNVQYSSGSSCYRPKTPDVRFEYCDLNAPWSSLLSDLPTRAYSTACGCKPDEWSAVQTEIPKEIRWVQRVYKFVAIVQKIYGLGSGDSAILGVKKIATEVNNVINPPPGSGVSGWWSDLIANLANGVAVLATADSKLEKIAEIVSALGYLADDALTYPNGTKTLGEIVKTEASELPSQTADRYRAASMQFGHFGDLIVTDYEKLKTIGKSTVIQIDEDTLNESAGQMMVGVYRFAYNRMLSSAYNTYSLAPNPASPNSTTPNDYKCFFSIGNNFKWADPWSGAGIGAYTNIQRNGPQLAVYGNTAPWYLAWGEKGHSTDETIPTPPTKLVAKIFQPITFDSNGIPLTFGAYGPWMFRKNFKVVPYQCNTGG